MSDGGQESFRDFSYLCSTLSSTAVFVLFSITAQFALMIIF